MKNFKFTIRGNQYDVNVQNIEDDVAEIEVNGTSYQVTLSKAVKTSKTPQLVRSKEYTAPSSSRTSKPTEKKGAGFIKAPLPGTILAISAKIGDTVKVGDTLLIMEAMKMENDIKSDKEGIVKAILVSNGASVLEGDILVEIGE